MSALRGINIGGWLIAERWMTPSLFEGVKGEGERAIGRELGKLEAEKRLNSHRATFITEQDFINISAEGFNFVRLPVGYWLFGSYNGFVSGASCVDAAFKWAAKYHLGIVLDFHGLQGSQNGQDHSGQVGKIRFYRWWHRWRALRTMERLAKRYGHEPALLGIEVINEPKADTDLKQLMHYYDRALAIAAQYTRDDVALIVSDAYQPLRLAKELARRNYGSRLVLDVHLYQLFSPQEHVMSFDQHLTKTSKEWGDLLHELRIYLPHIFVGEWSAALPAHAYKNVKGGEKANVGKYYQAQLTLFDQLSWGHAYWSYKAPRAGVWDWRSQSQFKSK